MPQPSSILDWRIKYGYSLGHVFNDLAAAFWFTYSLLFYKLSVGDEAYIFLVIGQLFDAAITVFAGLYFDAKFTKNAFFRLGKYKTWYLIGLTMIIFSFPLCFTEISLLIPWRDQVFTIYVFVVCAAQAGWAFCQISHLSLINELSISSDDRIWLSSVRQAASIYAAIVVYALFWFTLQDSEATSLQKQDIFVFANNSVYVTFFGLVHSLLFVVALKERTLVRQKEQCMLNAQEESSGTNCDPCQIRSRPMDTYNRKDWLTDLTFYKITLIYSMARLFLTVHFSYVPLYLQRTLYLPKTSIATVPLIIYLSGFIASFFSNYIERKFSNKFDLLLGLIFGASAALWTSFGTCHSESFKSIQIYGIAVLFGISTSIVKISTISLVADMIGQNTESTSFVYGTVSCIEKIVSGLTIGVLEQFNSESDLLHPLSIPGCLPPNITTLDACEHNLEWCPNGQHSVLFYHYIMSYGNALILAILLFGLLSIATIKFNKA